MFEEIDALPGAQTRKTFINGDAQAGVGEHGAHVGGGVVAALKRVMMPCLILWGPGLLFYNS